MKVINQDQFSGKDIMMRKRFAITVFFTIIFSFSLYAQEVSFTQEDRDRMIRLETNMEATDKRITDLREDLNRRFAELREDMNKRFEQMFSFLWIITGIFTTLTLGVIGFAFWDRKTAIRKSKEETIEEIEREGRLRDLINALRELAETVKAVIGDDVKLITTPTDDNRSYHISSRKIKSYD